MGISLRPSSCWVLHVTAAGDISRLLCSAAFVRLKAALIGSLTLFVAKTRSGGKVVDSYTPARRRASMLHGLGLESNLHVILNLRTDMQLLTCKHTLRTHTFGFPHIDQLYCLLYASFSRPSLHPASASVLLLTNGARQLVFLH